MLVVLLLQKTTNNNRNYIKEGGILLVCSLKEIW